MGRYKPKITDLSLTSLETLVHIRDGEDITLKQDATFFRELDAKFPGLIKIGPPMRNKLALFSVRCTPKGVILTDTYIIERARVKRKVEEDRAAAQRADNGPAAETTAAL